MPYKYGKHTHDYLGAYLFLFYFSFLYFGSVFIKTVIPLALVGYEMIIANLALHALAIYDLITMLTHGIIVNENHFPSSGQTCLHYLMPDQNS